MAHKGRGQTYFNANKC